MIERVLTFGPRAELIGILSLPEDGSIDHDRPAVLMWNVGVNHRVGPFRIYVDLARKLASEGFVAFRFDASGLGDSEVRREAVLDAERENLDLRDAMDAISRRTSVSSFVLVGFCSSVDAAHRVAMSDPRVAGVVHIESYEFRTLGYRLHSVKYLLSRVRWERYLRRRAAAVLQYFAPVPEPRDAAEPVYKRSLPTWPAFTRDLEELTQRGTSLLFVYASDSGYNHTSQFFEMFGSPRIDRRRLDVKFFARADHTFFDVEIRRAVIRDVAGWLKARFAVC